MHPTCSLAKHSNSIQGHVVTLIGAAVAAAGPRAPVPPRRPELGTLLNGTAFVPGACGPKPSSLGYQCSWAGPNGVILHWSYNVTHPPINRCTTNNAVPNAEARNNVTWLGDIGMHFALQVATRVRSEAECCTICIFHALLPCLSWQKLLCSEAVEHHINLQVGCCALLLCR